MMLLRTRSWHTGQIIQKFWWMKKTYGKLNVKD